MRYDFMVFVVGSTLFTLGMGFLVHPNWYWTGLIFAPLMVLGFYDMFQTKHAIMRNFPILGRG
ncbi:MAG: FMN-binding glutamate synthase family protein, partial [Saprospiraceae bacterium]|nr:FMN-binding glutamate synthase family protein [Saprospiraceae bacterium]